MPTRDLVRPVGQLTEREVIEASAIRVRTRIDLYVNLPKPQSSALPTKLQNELTNALAELSWTKPFKDLEFRLGPSDVAARSTKNLAGERALIPGLLAHSLTWTCNPPSVADTFEIVLRGDALPVDLRIFQSIQVFGWLFVHANSGESLDAAMERLKPGDPGCFGGVVDRVERDDANGEITLECRDFTALPLSREASPALIKSVDLGGNLTDIVKKLIGEVPGGDKWIVSPRGEINRLGSVETKLSEERRIKIKKGRYETKTVLDKDAVTSVQVANVEFNADQDTNIVRRVMGKKLSKLKITRYANGKQTTEVVPDSTPESYRQFLPIKAVRQYRPAKYQTKIIKPTPDRVFGSKKLTIWDAITRVCALMGVVAEVGISTSGNPMIVLVDGLEVHNGDKLRPFKRGKRKHRVLTHGHDMAQLVERRALVAGKKVNWVEVYSTDPVTGRTLRERFHDGTRDDDGQQVDSNGLTVFSHGCNSSDALKRIAHRVWVQVNRGELELSFSTAWPWTTGGSIHDPDLLYCKSGALVEVQFARVDRFRGLALEDYFKAAGVPAKAARKLAEASERLRPSLLFQVAEIVHNVGPDGEYQAEIAAQTLLDDIRLPTSETLEAV